MVELNPNITVSLIAGIVTLSGYFISRHIERKRIIEQQIREQKIPVYENFIAFVFKVIANKGENQVTEEEMAKFMNDFNKQSIVWLSDKSLKALINWRKAVTNQVRLENLGDTVDPKESILALEDLFLEFRKDIGHGNRGLNKGDLLSVFINDVDLYIVKK